VIEVMVDVVIDAVGTGFGHVSKLMNNVAEESF